MTSVAGFDEEVAAEARKLAELGGQLLVDLLLQLVGAVRVDSFVASHDGMHVVLLTVDLRTESSNESLMHSRPDETADEEENRSLEGFRARPSALFQCSW
jgi:hypothetical protein